MSPIPKLAAKDRKKVDAAEPVGDGFQPMPPGKYIATLSKVEAKTSSNGNPYWNAEFDNIVNLDGVKQPGRQWYMMMLPTSDTPPDGYPNGEEKWALYQRLCAGRIKGFFEAFGYSVDSDTDELIGEQVVLQIGIETIQKGAKAGQQTNRVNNIFALSSVDGADSIASGEADPDNF